RSAAPSPGRPPAGGRLAPSPAAAAGSARQAPRAPRAQRSPARPGSFPRTSAALARRSGWSCPARARRQRLREREYLLDRLGSVGGLADPHGHVVRRHRSRVAVVGLAVLVAAVGWLKLQVPQRVPAARQ